MLQMQNWHIDQPVGDDAQIGYAGENLTRTIDVHMDVVGDWVYRLEMSLFDGTLDILDTVVEGDLLYAVLNDSNLRCSGCCKVQVRGQNGNMVRKSNIVELQIEPSVGATFAYPAILPSAFSQMEARVTTMQAEAEGAAVDAKTFAVQAQASAKHAADSAAQVAEQAQTVAQLAQAVLDALNGTNGADGANSMEG